MSIRVTRTRARDLAEPRSKRSVFCKVMLMVFNSMSIHGTDRHIMLMLQTIVMIFPRKSLVCIMYLGHHTARFYRSMSETMIDTF